MHLFYLLVVFEIGIAPSNYFFLSPTIVRFDSFPYMNRFDDRHSLCLQDVLMWMWQLQVCSVC